MKVWVGKGCLGATCRSAPCCTSLGGFFFESAADEDDEEDSDLETLEPVEKSAK